MEQQHIPAPAVASCQSRPDAILLGSEVRDPRLEDYLDRVMAPLVERVPYAERRVMRAEMAEHLDALMEACEELGSADPVEDALAQFGAPHKVSRSWCDVTGEAPQRSFHGFGESLLLAGKLFGGATLAFWLTVLWTIYAQPPSEGVGILMGVSFVALLPVAMGLVVGMRAQSRPGLACLSVISFLTVITYAAAHALPALMGTLGIDHPDGDALRNGLGAVPMISCTYWLALGSISAGMSRWAVNFSRNWSRRRQVAR